MKKKDGSVGKAKIRQKSHESKRFNAKIQKNHLNKNVLMQNLQKSLG